MSILLEDRNNDSIINNRLNFVRKAKQIK